MAIVVAVGEKNEIGKGGDLLWRLPKDMKFFKEVTMGHHVLMGRKTWESLPPRYKPLDGRTNMVITRQPDFQSLGAMVFRDIETAVRHAEGEEETELMIIGGGEIYREAFEQADIIYLTRVHHSFADADTFFPEIKNDVWKETSCIEHPADEKHAYAFSFIKLERK